MNQQNKKQVMIAGALAAVLVIIVVYQLFIAGGATMPPDVPVASTAPKTAAAPRPTTAPSAQPTMLVTVDIDPEQLLRDVEVVPFDYQLNRIDRNPMSPLIGTITSGREAVFSPGTLQTVDVLQKKVSGILWDDREPMAVVDNEVVAPGHVYPDGVQVHAIEQDRVVFKVGDSYYPVPIKEL